MILLARLAVDEREQGKGSGARILADALRKAVAAGEVAAARLIVVDAVDEDAARFYERHRLRARVTAAAAAVPEDEGPQGEPRWGGFVTSVRPSL